MNLVTLDNVKKQYSERVLLDGVDLLINAGDRIGLIGVNGSGKTTLLRIIAGLEPVDSGQMTVWGGVRIQYLPQEPWLEDSFTVLEQLFAGDAAPIRLLRDYEWVSRQLQQQPTDQALQAQFSALTAEMDRTGGWAAEAQVKAILTRLGITDFAAPLTALSGGERKRVALAQALIDPADLLILDEPTNHIDADTIAWLETYLMNAPGALLMVTHDRYFLDRVANRIVDLDRRRLVNYPGNYQRYLEQRAAREANLATAEQKRQGILRRELEWLRRGAMARTTKQKARKQRIEELQQIRYDLGEERLLMALASRRLGKQVLTVRGVSKRYDDLQLFEGVDFELAPGDRVGMIGPNGAGKSTFLDILAGYVAPDAGEVRWGETVRLGYYDQQSRGLVDQMKVIDFINERAPLVRTPDGTRVEAAQMLEWFLFPRPQQQAQIGALSGGERRRLYLLSVLVHQPNVLLLDEPTNDLDVPTLAVLESFLDRFEGVLLVVSHDRYFLDRTVDYLAVFENGRFSPRYPAPYSSYQRLRQAEPETAVADEDAEARETAVVTRPRRPERPRRLTWKEQRELEQLNQRVDALEGEKSGLQQAINASGGDYVRLQQLAGRLQHVEAELDGLLERWIELSEIDAHA
jgi:ABC transport system ATP-binding/permease protein